ncbi:MAG: AMP-binding protein, partial [Actinomycetia bacterium]|nr:AMP-binding protein [Actinomycetes bacterium]
MAYPGEHARTRPNHPAVIMAGSGETLTYRDLDERSNQLAHLLRGQGLERGAHIALFMENNIRYMEVIWAAFRTGLYITAVNSFLSTPEVEYILDDCDAQLVVGSRAKAEVAGTIDPAQTPTVECWLMVDGVVADAGGPVWESYESTVETMPTTPVPDESPGFTMLYSSGTTGRPKGVKRPLPGHAIDEL